MSILQPFWLKFSCQRRSVVMGESLLKLGQDTASGSAIADSRLSRLIRARQRQRKLINSLQQSRPQFGENSIQCEHELRLPTHFPFARAKRSLAATYIEDQAVFPEIFKPRSRTQIEDAVREPRHIARLQTYIPCEMTKKPNRDNLMERELAHFRCGQPLQNYLFPVPELLLPKPGQFKKCFLGISERHD